jgi:hypothetical protein
LKVIYVPVARRAARAPSANRSLDLNVNFHLMGALYLFVRSAY